MAKKPKKQRAGTPYVLPGTPTVTHKKWRAAALAAGLLLVLAVVAARVFVREQPRLVVWLMGLACAAWAAAVYALATHEPQHDEMALRLQRGLHLDFGKALRTSRKERRKVKLPLVGETTVRRVVGACISAIVFAWWLTPWAPVAVAERKIEDLSVPLSGEIMAAVLVMPDANLATVQPPIMPQRAKRLAAGIPADAAAYQRGRKALAEGRYDDARALLGTALGEAADPADVHAAVGQAELYAYRFPEALTAYEKALALKPREPALSCQAAVAAIHLGQFARADRWTNDAVKVLEEKPEAAQTPDDQRALAAALHLRATLLTVVARTGAEYEEALKLFDRAKKLQAREDVLGPGHPYLAATVNNQAVLSQLRSRFAGVQAMHDQARDIWSRGLGKRHPLVAASLDNLAMYRLVVGDYASAWQCNREALAILRESFPADAPDNPVLAVALNGASILERTYARYREAETLAQQALAAFEKAFGPDHPAVASAASTLASLYGELARYVTIAKPFFLRAESVAVKTLGAEHPYVAVVFNKQAQLCLAQGQYGAAKDLAEKALKIATAAYGEEHTVVAAVLNTLGRAELELGSPGSARPHLEKALRVLEKTVGKEGPDVAVTLGNLAALDSGPVTYLSGVKRYQQAIAMTEGLLGAEQKEHPAVASLSFRTAQLLAQNRRFSEAEPYLKRAMDIQEAALVPSQPNHPDLAGTLEAYAALLRQLNPPDNARADKMLARAADIRAKHQEEDRPKTP